MKGRDITACLCVITSVTLKSLNLGVFLRGFIVHMRPDVKTDCMVCHLWEPGKNFGLPGEKISLGVLTKEEMDLIQRIFESWSRSAFLDALHADRDISCTSCHGDKLPTSSKTVGSDRCLACHGSYADLASQTTRDQFPNRNPHKSHLGEIDCSVCHQVHGTSKVYCLRCHRNWAMKIPGGSAR